MIIGAGGVGRVVTYKCAQHPEVFSEIMLASRTRSKCDAIADEREAVQLVRNSAQMYSDRIDAHMKLEQQLLSVLSRLYYDEDQTTSISQRCRRSGQRCSI